MIEISSDFISLCQKKYPFPHYSLANPYGIVAIGGDLSAERLISAYASGAFPWFSELPIRWHNPHERFVLFLNKYHISHSLKKIIKKNVFNVTFDTAFSQVIKLCAEVRKNSTWITSEMIDAYINLHQLGFAHSVETWYNNELVGGLYGVSLGKTFFGESMFYLKSNASKVALYYLVQRLLKWKFCMIDCQVYTNFFHSQGAILIFPKLFHWILKKSLKYNTKIKKW